MIEPIEKAIEAVQKEMFLYNLASGDEVEFLCPRSPVDKSVRRDEHGKVETVTFSSAPDYAFFTGIREILSKRYGEKGAFLANLLAADFDPDPFPKKEDYNPLCATILRDIRMVSLADPDGGTRYDTNVPSLVKRWEINYTNLSPFTEENIGISPQSPEFIHMNDPKNKLGADFAWVCNVISIAAIEDPDPYQWDVNSKRVDIVTKQMMVYQTFAAMAEMVKPQTGQFLLVNTLDQDVHLSVDDWRFHQLIGVRPRTLGSSRYSLFERTQEKEPTLLELSSWIQTQRDRILDAMMRGF